MVKLTEVINILQTYVEGAVPHNIHKVEHIIWNQEEKEEKLEEHHFINGT